jgi:hypothetical protein
MGFSVNVVVLSLLTLQFFVFFSFRAGTEDAAVLFLLTWVKITSGVTESEGEEDTERWVSLAIEWRDVKSNQEIISILIELFSLTHIMVSHPSFFFLFACFWILQCGCFLCNSRAKVCSFFPTVEDLLIYLIWERDFSCLFQTTLLFEFTCLV